MTNYQIAYIESKGLDQDIDDLQDGESSYLIVDVTKIDGNDTIIRPLKISWTENEENEFLTDISIKCSGELYFTDIAVVLEYLDQLFHQERSDFYHTIFLNQKTGEFDRTLFVSVPG
jgi:hypothetical protein